MKSKLIKLLFILQLCVALDLSASVETGVLFGSVIDEQDAYPLSGVMVSVPDYDVSARTDMKGRYRLEGVPSGVVNITFIKGGYQLLRITEMQINPAEVHKLDVGMLERELVVGSEYDVYTMDAIVIEGEIAADSQIGMLAERQRSIRISDAVGAEHFEKFSLSDAGEAMTKVTGASLVDGKYVFVRGLGDRYTNTTLNGASIPSADPDKRAVQMDQFPSDLLESVVTSKSFTPDQPGSFAGGSVNIKTKSYPEQFFVKIGGSIEYNTNTSNEDIWVSEQGVNFWANSKDDREVSFDQDVSSSFGNVTGNDSESIANAQEINAVALEFAERFYPKKKNAPMNYGFSVSFGDSIELSETSKFGYTASFTWDEEYSHYNDGTEIRYETPSKAKTGTVVKTSQDNLLLKGSKNDWYEDGVHLEPGSDPWEGDVELGVNSSTSEVSWGAFTKLSYMINQNNEFGLTLFHNQSADDEISIGRGTSSLENIEVVLPEQMTAMYTERAISSAQLTGEHLLEGFHEVKINWLASYSLSTQDQPDFRNLIWGWDYEEEEIVETKNDWGSDVAARRFREMEEDTTEYKVDFEIPFLEESKIKTGFLYSESTRDYDEKVFNIASSERESGWEGSNSEYSDFEQYYTDGIQQIYTDGRIGYDIDVLTESGSVRDARDGRSYMTGSNQAGNSYEGDGETLAAYVMAETPMFEHWNFIYGLRWEDNEMTTEQYVSSLDVGDEDGVVEGGFDSTDALPAITAIYSITENMNLRMAYGKTIAKPTYKELGYIETTDPFTGDVYQGNPYLERTIIDNFDLRWEWFMEGGQVFAVSVFYKDMDKPIETIVSPGYIISGDEGDIELRAGNIVPYNVEEGEVYGIEFEWRYNLGGITESLEPFTIGGNVSFIESETTVPDEEIEINIGVNGGSDKYVERERDLIGQSPFLANLDISYDNYELGTYITLSYNYTDERLVAVEASKRDGLGNVFEESTETLNLNYSQRLSAGWKFKFKAKNLLNEEYVSYHENLAGNEKLIRSSSSKGITYGLSFSYTFN